MNKKSKKRDLSRVTKPNPDPEFDALCGAYERARAQQGTYQKPIAQFVGKQLHQGKPARDVLAAVAYGAAQKPSISEADVRFTFSWVLTKEIEKAASLEERR